MGLAGTGQAFPTSRQALGQGEDKSQGRGKDRFCGGVASRGTVRPAERDMEIYIGAVGAIAAVFVVIFGGRGLIDLVRGYSARRRARPAPELG